MNASTSALTITATSINSRMTSLEIAELTGKEHKNVMRDIKSLIDQGAINELSFELVNYKDAKGESRPMYSLDFHATMTLITGYDAKRRAIVIDRWMKLETGEATPAMLSPKKKADTVAAKYRDACGIVRSVLSIGKLLGTSEPMAKAIAVEDARRCTGIDCTNLLPVGKVEEVPVGVRKLAELSGIPERKLSAMLVEKNLITKDETGMIALTDKAKELRAGSMEPFKSRHSAHSGYQCKWFPSVVIPVLQEVEQ